MAVEPKKREQPVDGADMAKEREINAPESLVFHPGELVEVSWEYEGIYEGPYAGGLHKAKDENDEICTLLSRDIKNLNPNDQGSFKAGEKIRYSWKHSGCRFIRYVGNEAEIDFSEHEEGSIEIVPLSQVQKVAKLVSRPGVFPEVSTEIPESRPLSKSRPLSSKRWLAHEGKVKVQIGTTTINRGKWCQGFATRRLVDGEPERRLPCVIRIQKGHLKLDIAADVAGLWSKYEDRGEGKFTLYAGKRRSSRDPVQGIATLALSKDGTHLRGRYSLGPGLNGFWRIEYVK
jgi:hypothetical protein